jgi:hypothetical protein
MLSSFRGRVAPQKMAIGLTGEPVAARSRRGATTQRNDQRFSSSHTATKVIELSCPRAGDGVRADAVVEDSVEDDLTQGVDVLPVLPWMFIATRSMTSESPEAAARLVPG